MQKINRRIVKKTMCSDEATESCRGLERTADEFRHSAMKMKIRQVVGQQASNRWASTPTSGMMRSVATGMSKSDIRKGVLVGLQDATEANRIYKETIEAALVDKCFC